MINMKKDQILAVLRDGKELSLSEIYEKIYIDSFDEQTLSKPLILHHLNNMVRDGLLIKNDKKYKITNIDFGQGDSLNIDSLDTIVLPRIIARAGAAEKVIPDTIDTSTVKLNKNRYKPEDLILVEVAGNSMTPTFQDGELLLFKKFQLGETPSNNQIILARIDNGAKIKRFVNVNNFGLLLSDNVSDPDNSPIPVDDDNFAPIAKYVSKIL